MTAHRDALLPLACLSVALAWSSTAAADGFTWGRGTINGGPRYASDDLNLGLGLNGGGTLDMGVYIGGVGGYFFGDSDEVTTGFATVEASFSALFLMAEGGYDFGVAPAVVLRPTLGLGVVTGFVEVCTEVAGEEDCESDSESEFNGQLGGQALYDLGGLTLGGELRLLFGEFEAVWLGANIGGSF